MQRIFIVAAASVAFLTGALTGMAVAQDTLGIPLKSATPPSKEEAEKQKAADRAYDAALHKIPERKTPVDPWGTIRPSAPATAKNKPDNKAN